MKKVSPIAARHNYNINNTNESETDMALTQKQLTVWNNKKTKLGGVSANENWNVSIGLPDPETRKILNKVHDANFGCMYPAAKVTMKMYRDYLEIHHA